MFDTFKNRLELSGRLETITALRIGAGRSTDVLSSDLPVVKDLLAQPYIPGASFKGALRSRLESFLRGVFTNVTEPDQLRKLVANPANEREWSITAAEIKDFKKEYEKDDQGLTAKILEKTDLISKLFGSPWLASKVQIRDLYVVEGTWFGQYQERDGVAINRDTETAENGKLYDFQVVPAGTEFNFQALVENADDWELGLLMLGLHQFETEQITLGGGSSRGLGVVKLNITEMNWFSTNPDDPEVLLNYLQKLTQGSKAEVYVDARAKRDEWVKALIQKLREKSQRSSTPTAQGK